MAERLKARIRSEGPLSVAAFMTEAMFHPREGYYATKDPIGAGADFITAPEVSQMFGEMLGAWAAQAWLEMGRPETVQLIELGPGKGTMMADMLRAARALPEFEQAIRVTLVEASAALKSVQAQTLGHAHAPISWADRLEAAPAGPAIIIGNEFLDCLPVRQAVKEKGAWRERVVALDGENFVYALGGVLGPEQDLIPETLRDAADGTLVELRPGDRQLVDLLAARFADSPGRALFIDYGPALSEPGDTLQALRRHQKVEALDDPGTADLTARVDFQSLVEAARAADLAAHGPVEQGAFLTGLGIEHRAAALIPARADQRQLIARQLFRLTDESQMGRLFKLACLESQDLPVPAGF
jgi:NADH dehydrogenase [ubiquinone] 1 alpha subcomplex assembly factor 7